MSDTFAIRLRARALPWVVVTLLAVFVVGCGGQPTAAECGPKPTGADIPSGPLGDQATDGQPLPVVTLFTLDDCTPVTTTTMIGQPLVINFWASWCGPCKTEMPALDEVSRDLAGQVRFIGVTFQDDPIDSRAFLLDFPVSYDNFVDAGGEELFRAAQARGTPSTLLVDSAGEIVYRHAGPISAAQLRSAIQQHLGITTEVSANG